MSYSPEELKAWTKYQLLHLHSEPTMKNTSICLFEKSLVSSANRSRFKLLTCEPKLKTDVDLNKLA